MASARFSPIQPNRKILFSSHVIHKVVYLVVCFGFVLGLTIKPGIDASPLQDSPLSSEERKVEIMKARSLPAGAPVTITAVRNLQDQDWLRNLEIEVQNTSIKPIYYLEIETYFPDLPKVIAVDGIERKIMIRLIYGRQELSHLSQRPDPTDIPIRPGEKYSLRIPEAKGQGLASILTERHITPAFIKKIRLRIFIVNLGDGTGVQVGQPYSGSQSVTTNSPGDQLAISTFEEGLTKKVFFLLIRPLSSPPHT